MAAYYTSCQTLWSVLIKTLSKQKHVLPSGVFGATLVTIHPEGHRAPVCIVNHTPFDIALVQNVYFTTLQQNDLWHALSSSSQTWTGQHTAGMLGLLLVHLALPRLFVSNGPSASLSVCLYDVSYCAKFANLEEVLCCPITVSDLRDACSFCSSPCSLARVGCDCCDCC